MTAADARFGAEVITKRGKVHTFDSAECLIAWLLAEPDDRAEGGAVWVSDYNDPGVLIRAGTAAFLASDGIRSPMGLGIAAFASPEARDAARDSLGGEALAWPGAQAWVRSRWPQGRPPAHASAAHTETDPFEPAPAADSAAPRVPAPPDEQSGKSGWSAREHADSLSTKPAIETISERIRRATAGERIVIPAGVYREATIVVDRPLEIIGEPGAVLDGEGKRQIMTIVADDVTVRGLMFREVGSSFVEDRAAIEVDGARNCRIENNQFENAFFAIYLSAATNCHVVRNTLEARSKRETTSGNGIHAWSSSGLVIEGNTIRGHRDGIYFEFVKASRVEGNLSEDNLRYGLHFMFSDDCEYINNSFRRNGAGVAVMYASRVRMEGNRFEENRGSSTFGLLLKDIQDSRIAANQFKRNSIALYSEGSRRVDVEGNDFENNGWAIKVMASSVDNEFSANNFQGNSFDVATNSRANSNVFTGNYWDAYRGYDLDRDGTGDVGHRPVRLFSLLVEQNEPNLILTRSFVVQLLDVAEAVIPALVPETLVDGAPRMARIERYRGGP
jgi:nitrous oxidase accessory protein